jgi:hypothetical protein
MYIDIDIDTHYKNVMENHNEQSCIVFSLPIAFPSAGKLYMYPCLEHNHYNRKEGLSMIGTFSRMYPELLWKVCAERSVYKSGVPYERLPIG